MTKSSERDAPGSWCHARAALHAQLLPVFVERIRAGLVLCGLALPLFGLGDLLYHRETIAPLVSLKAVCLGLLCLGYLFVRFRPPSWRGCVAIALTVIGGMSIVAALSDAIVNDVLTTFLLAIVLDLGASAVLPWGSAPQIATCAITSASVLVHVAVAPVPAGVFYPPAVATVLAAVASVYVAAAFERHRVARLRIEASLWDSEARKGAILDAALDPIVTIDATGRVVEWNPAAERTFGLSRADALGRDVGALVVPPAIRPLFRSVIARYLASHESWVFGRRLETTALRVDGSEVPVELTAVAIDREGPPLFTAYLRDLTERRLAAEAQVSAVLVRVGREMMQLLDTATVVERLGGVVRELLEANRTVTLLRGPGDDGFLVLRDSGRIVEGRIPLESMAPLLGRVDDEGLVALVGTVERELPAGVPRLLGLARTALCLALWEGDDVVGVHVAGFYERHEEFSAQERRIARGVAQIASMALTNARLVEELARASRVKSEFLSTMSHELRTPINVVIGYAEMAGDRDVPGTERDACLARIRSAGRELLDLVEGALDVGKLEAGASDVRIEPIDLRAFWASMHASCLDLNRRPGQVDLVWGDGVPRVVVMTDARKLSAIVRNLVGNACKFTEHGQVAVDLVFDAGVVRIAVVDTGVGIHPADRRLVFEMFRQADGSETRRFGGTGVGLYIVRRFVEQLGGDVAVESTPGRGSTFTVALPCPAVAAVPAGVAGAATV